MKLPYALRRSFLVGAFFLGATAVAVLAVKPPLLDNVAFSRAVFDRHGQLLRLTLAKDQQYRLFTPLQDMAPQFRDAVLLQEDQYFYDHPGVNPVSLFRAFVHTYISGGRKIGASTISMQLARLQYGINSRHISGKLLQMFRAMQIEAHYSKDEILEAYLNHASYGYNIEGVGAASFIYFHKSPRDLTLPEAAELAVIPQSPLRRRPDRNDPAKPALVEARNRLFDRWLEQHPDDSVQKPFFSLPMPVFVAADLPHEAPHLTRDLLTHYKDTPQITSTIDLETQNLLERILRKYVEDRRDMGIKNASALLVDTRNMQVAASIGSSDFLNRSIQGQVDGTRAKRSPGSTLKPFIYALGIDQGLIHPLSILGDAPVNFGSYAPDNFDRDFRGPISARNALRLSRNIPAIKLAADLHNPDLYVFMQKAGIAGLRNRSSYGLSLVLGGAEVTPRELAGLYAMLANDGELKPLIFQTTKPEPSQSQRMLSPEASFMALDMLADRPHRDAVQDMPVYWKTGTSNGFHDAWTAGIFGHYALVVWVGNFNGDANATFTGMRAASPLFFALTDAVNGKERNRDIVAEKPAHLHIRKVDVCAATGDVSLDDCPSRDQTWFIPGVSPIRNHDVYRKILVDTRTGRRACQFENGVTAYKVFQVWPSDLQQTLRESGIHVASIPPWQDGCSDADETETSADTQKPTITSPQAGVDYHVHLQAGDDAVPFNASADGEVHTLHWFLDNQYLGASSPGEALLWRPQPGRYSVKVVDDRGRSDTTHLNVSLIQ